MQITTCFETDKRDAITPVKRCSTTLGTKDDDVFTISDATFKHSSTMGSTMKLGWGQCTECVMEDDSALDDELPRSLIICKEPGCIQPGQLLPSHPQQPINMKPSKKLMRVSTLNAKDILSAGFQVAPFSLGLRSFIRKNPKTIAYVRAEDSSKDGSNEDGFEVDISNYIVLTNGQNDGVHEGSKRMSLKRKKKPKQSKNGLLNFLTTMPKRLHRHNTKTTNLKTTKQATKNQRCLDSSNCAREMENAAKKESAN